MAQHTNIEWCHHTVNLWHGCNKVHEGCKNCYAERLSNRWGNHLWGPGTPRKEIKSAFGDLRKFQKLAKKANEVHRVFVGSMMDIFEERKIISDNLSTHELRFRLFFDIAANEFPNLQFLFLTKRPGNIIDSIYEDWLLPGRIPSNIMFGCSISTQAHADEMIPRLLETPGKHFLSIEPQLEDISIYKFPTGIDWVIQGGESGPKKRPFDLQWATNMQFECEYLGIPYFFKQIDKVQPIPEQLKIQQFPND